MSEYIKDKLFGGFAIIFYIIFIIFFVAVKFTSSGEDFFYDYENHCRYFHVEEMSEPSAEEGQSYKYEKKQEEDKYTYSKKIKNKDGKTLVGTEVEHDFGEYDTREACEKDSRQWEMKNKVSSEHGYAECYCSREFNPNW